MLTSNFQETLNKEAFGMNFKNILTIAALTGFSASVAIGQGTAPTIVQGDYVSNVFGQSNFVKNPNAKLNTKNVSVSGATATRSTTTPLVATSEYNVAVTSANGTVSWATRSFDEGMKNQNCEARFSYRGFQATSKAQIKQGANVVAELTLTPSATDPRIASINFPCGDLSSATTFVITDSATLSGTNEIGGIYVGLATNMANVAQAEMVVTARANAGNIIPTAVYTTVRFQNETLDKYGEYDPTTGIFTAKRAGHYYVKSQIFWEPNAGFSVGQKNFVMFKNSSALYNTGNYEQNTVYEPLQIAGGVDLNVGDTISLRAYQSSGSDKSVFGVGEYTNLTISRFPSSSELVVTPETQNVWGVIQGNGNDSLTSSATYVTPSFFTITSTKGKCEADSTNMACKIAYLPAGSYRVTATVPYLVQNTTGQSACHVQIADNKGSGTLTTQQIVTGFASNAANSGVNVSRTFTYASAQTNVVFSFQHKKVLGSSCGVYTSSSDRYFEITVQPLDNASNSALYVQGPVKAAETGAAIPDGYAGNVRSFRSSGCGTNGTYNAGASLTIQPGVWRVTGTANLFGGGGITDFLAIIAPTPGGTQWRQSFWNDSWFSEITVGKLPIMTPPFYVRYDGTTLYYFDNGAWGSPVASGTGSLYVTFYRSSSACTNVYTQIQAERIN
jgi:hypothetical protein